MFIKKIIIYMYILMMVMFCKTTQTVQIQTTQVPLPKADTNTVPASTSVVATIASKKEDFFNPSFKHKDEVFRVFGSSQGYEIKQMAALESLKVEDDVSGNMSFSTDLQKYDKVDYQAQALVRLMLYQDNGKVSRIRFVRSSGISEIDKMIGDDLTRWKFIFLDEKNVAPTEFVIVYQIILSNKMNDKEAVKELLKKYVDH